MRSFFRALLSPFLSTNPSELRSSVPGASISLSARSDRHPEQEGRDSRSLGTVSGARRVAGSVLDVQIGRPIVHEPPPTLEQIRPGIGRFDLVRDHVRERGLDDLARVIRVLGRPVAETRPEPMRYGNRLPSAGAANLRRQIRPPD